MNTHLIKDRTGHDGASLARGLGWFSVGLGLAEMAAPRTLAKLIGVDHGGKTPVTLRALGVREIVSGLGILVKPRRPGPLWARVAGDALDLGLMAWALGSKRTSAQRLTAAIVGVVGVTALDVLASQRMQKAAGDTDMIQRSKAIIKDPGEVYQYWRNFERLPTFMYWLESVKVLSSTRSHWVARLPTGIKVEWDAEIIEDVPGQRIVWRSVGGVEVDGTVTFAPGLMGGTVVNVEMKVRSGGKLGAMLGKLFAGKEIDGDLRRFKQVIETGEVMKSDASIHPGRPHPAQPSKIGDMP